MYFCPVPDAIVPPRGGMEGGVCWYEADDVIFINVWDIQMNPLNVSVTSFLFLPALPVPVLCGLFRVYTLYPEAPWDLQGRYPAGS